MSEPPRCFEVAPEDVGRRLDLILADRLSLSRAQSRRLLARGCVRIDGRVMSLDAKGTVPRRGSQVEIEPFTRPEDRRIVPQPELALSVLAEGDGWIAVDKPAGVPVHPLEEQERGTLLNALVARAPELHGVGEGALRSGVVHRLDVDTSGVLLVATQEESWNRLREAFAAQRVEKVYRAVVLGQPESAGVLALPLVVARHRPARVRVLPEAEWGRARGAREVRLRWRTLERFAEATLLEVRPETGFLHQIRAVFAHLGHPLAGDRAYGPASDPTGAARHMLHASRVAFEDIAAGSPDAPDFAGLCAGLRTASAGA